MPSKSRRAASRQAQLQRRRRRGKSRTQVFDPGPMESESPTLDPAVETEEAAPPAEPVLEAPPAPRRVRRSRREADAEAAPAYQHLGSELRRIGAITTLIVLMLIGLTFLLR